VPFTGNTFGTRQKYRPPAAISCRAAQSADGCPSTIRGFAPQTDGNTRRNGLAQLLLYVSVKEQPTRMFDNLFGIHERALLLHGQRIGVLATNLANADTPNYKARDIDFSEVLAHTGEESLPMRVTQAAHITLSDGELPAGDLKYRNPYQASLDGNTVEMPVEQAAFSENNVRYQASLTFINLKISQMQLAIAGQ
jgi:flagellar basal-body rod protein FlgB